MHWTALIVDDSMSMRALLRNMLEGKGVTVVEAENGGQGVLRVRQTAVDVIITDVHMPVMDGLKMIREIRSIPQHRTTPIFVLTTDATPKRLEEGRKAGATAWLIKLANPEVLWKGIEKVLNRPAPDAPDEQRAADDRVSVQP